MSLSRSIRKATKAALRSINSIAEDIKFHRTASAVYDVDTGADKRRTVPIPLKGWFTSFEERHIDGNNVQPGDKRLTFSVTDVDIEPTLSDFIVDGSDQKWEIINIKLPPPKILYILQVRRP